MRRSPTKWCAVAGLLVLVVGSAWAAAAAKLYLNGKVASSNVQMVNGKPYVPVADVAKALGMVVNKRAGGYEIIAAGGANQLQGSKQGKLGDELFTGKWRFQVTSVQDAGSEYQERYYQAKRILRPQGSGETLLVVNCRLKNGTKKAVQPLLTERLPGNTALADTEGRSYPPIDFDARQESDKIQSYAAAALLPGAAMDVALVFSVPKGMQPKSLVFSIGAYPDNVGKAGTDVRVELTK